MVTRIARTPALPIGAARLLADFGGSDNVRTRPLCTPPTHWRALLASATGCDRLLGRNRRACRPRRLLRPGQLEIGKVVLHPDAAGHQRFLEVARADRGLLETIADLSHLLAQVLAHCLRGSNPSQGDELVVDFVDARARRQSSPETLSTTAQASSSAPSFLGSSTTR